MINYLTKQDDQAKYSYSVKLLWSSS